MVTWLRKNDFQVIGSEEDVYTNDRRFVIRHTNGSDEWTLQIKQVQKNDSGMYECQVPIKGGILASQVRLEVVMPQAIIMGHSKEYYVDRGSTVTLICVINKTTDVVPFVYWYQNSTLMNFYEFKNIKIISDSSSKLQSRLIIKDISSKDSGNYTCSAPNIQSDHIMIFVSDGDKTAAVQRRKSSSSTLRSFSWQHCLLIGVHLVASACT